MDFFTSWKWMQHYFNVIAEENRPYIAVVARLRRIKSKKLRQIMEIWVNWHTGKAFLWQRPVKMCQTFTYIMQYQKWFYWLNSVMPKLQKKNPKSQLPKFLWLSQKYLYTINF